MADVLQATAQGPSPAAAAVWAAVPGRMLERRLEEDPAFADAVAGAAALAAAHGLRTKREPTPARLRVALIAISRGESWRDAARLSGIAASRFQEL